MEPKPMPPLLVKSFPKTPRTPYEEASQFGGGSYKVQTKQTNNLPSFID
jgi:hypothetical protein